MWEDGGSFHKLTSVWEKIKTGRFRNIHGGYYAFIQMNYFLNITKYI